MGVPVGIAETGKPVVRYAAPRQVGPGRLDAGTEGVPASFEAIAERNATFMFRVAHGLLRNSHDAEDAVQEVLLKLCRTGAWRGIVEERAFLARAVWRVGLDVAARRARHAGVEGTGEPADARMSTESTVIASGERELLHRLVNGLPDELRQPLILCAIEEMTSREVGAALGIPEGTVRTRVARARAELRRRYGEMKGGEAPKGDRR